MLTLKNGEVVEVSNLDPGFHHENGEAAKMAIEWMKRYEDLHLFGEDQIMDILGLACEQTGGICDPKLAVKYGIWYGIFFGELKRKKDEEARQIWIGMDPSDKR